MDKKTQDLAWACLPKEVRDKAKNYYKYAGVDSIEKEVLQDLFGHHNLTSDTEPEEMLMVERKKVQELRRRFLKYKTEESLKGDTDFYDGELNALNMLFGDKCLPDDEKQNSPKLSNAFQIGKDEPSSLWRSVKDILPFPECDVLVSMGCGEFGVAYLSALDNGTYRWGSCDDTLSLDDIRYWMPIPAPP